MSGDQFIAFVMLSGAMFAAPGPVVVFSIRNGILYGAAAGVLGVCGNMTALFLMTLTGASALGFILVYFDQLFQLVRVVGAIYLVYLGWRMWRMTTHIMQTFLPFDAPLWLCWSNLVA